MNTRRSTEEMNDEYQLFFRIVEHSMIRKDLLNAIRQECRRVNIRAYVEYIDILIKHKYLDIKNKTFKKPTNDQFRQWRTDRVLKSLKIEKEPEPNKPTLTTILTNPFVNTLQEFQRIGSKIATEYNKMQKENQELKTQIQKLQEQNQELSNWKEAIKKSILI